MTSTSERTTRTDKNLFYTFRAKRTERLSAQDLCMDRIFDDYLADVKPRVKPTTFSTYRSVLNGHISPALGQIHAARLTEDDVSNYMTSICGEGSGLSDASVRMIAGVLRGALKFAPCRGVNVSPELCRVPKKQRRPSVQVLTEDERGQLLTALGPCPAGKDLGILLSLKTGLRVGEVCALKWGDISFEQGVLTVRRTVQRIKADDGGTRLYFGDPKSADSHREVPLTPAVLDVLGRQKRPDDCFIVSGVAGRTVEPRTMQRHFKTVLKHAGMRDLNYHALRHTFATRCVEHGFDVKSLSVILGHADVKTTMNIYVHPSQERLRDMMAKVD